MSKKLLWKTFCSIFIDFLHILQHYKGVKNTMKKTEIEIQVNIENKKPLMEFLKNNAQFKSENQQIDEYFSPIHRNFIEVRPVKEWFRLRDSGKDYSINYKNWHIDNKGRSIYCDEYETKIENLDTIKEMLKILNFKTIAKVKKTRKTWDYKDYEINIDSVENLGDFVEIEYIGKENVNPEEITNQMVDFLKNLGCGTIKRNYKGYPFQLLFPDEIEYEEL